MRKIFFLGFLSFILGYLINSVIQVQSSSLVPLPVGRKRELIKNINNLEKERKSLRRKIIALEEKLKKIESKALINQGSLDKYNAELRKAQMHLGLLAARGPGLEITLNDSLNIPPGADPNNYLIHDYDLRVIINALLKGGAEAISINDHRLIFTSTIRCVGATIMVNSFRLAPPYIIRAIGSPSELLKALSTDEESKAFFEEYVPSFGLQARLKKVEEISLPAYQEPLGALD